MHRPQIAAATRTTGLTANGTQLHDHLSRGTGQMADERGRFMRSLDVSPAPRVNSPQQDPRSDDQVRPTGKLMVGEVRTTCPTSVEHMQSRKMIAGRLLAHATPHTLDFIHHIGNSMMHDTKRASR